MLRTVNLSEHDLLHCARRGEGTRMEFKRRLPRDERAARTLCAFANTRGGLLLVGITDRGRIHGVHHPELVQASLHRLGQQWLAPALSLEVQVVEVSGPKVVACSVPCSRERPHALLSPSGEREVLVRVGASNRIADGPTLAALRRGSRSARGLSPLEQEILDWVGEAARTSRHPGGSATVARFARAHNLGEGRARRAFVRLETAGLLLGHGAGRGRIFTRP